MPMPAINAHGDAHGVSAIMRSIDAILDRNPAPHPVRQGLPDPAEIRRSMRRWMVPVREPQLKTQPVPVQPSGRGRYILPTTSLPESAEQAREIAARLRDLPGVQPRRVAQWLTLVASEMDEGLEPTLLYRWAETRGHAHQPLYGCWRDARKGVLR